MTVAFLAATSVGWRHCEASHSSDFIAPATRSGLPQRLRHRFSQNWRHARIPCDDVKSCVPSALLRMPRRRPVDGVVLVKKQVFDTSIKPRVVRMLCFALSVALIAVARTHPAFAAVTGPLSGVNTAWRGLDPAGFTAGLAASFFLVLASEIGDKTFFISALLSMKYSRLLVLLGTMLALGSMTVISVAIGQVFHALPPSLNTSIPFDDYAAAALLVWFGFQNIRDGLSMRNEEDEELRDAEEVVEEATSKQENGPSSLRVVSETSSLVFLAEWGDKSMLATVALAAAKNPWGVIVGGISGHLAATFIAVIGGSFLGKYISERTARLIGGVLFLVFAALTVFNLF